MTIAADIKNITSLIDDAMKHRAALTELGIVLIDGGDVDSVLIKVDQTKNKFASAIQTFNLGFHKND